eukprot:EG_transcript_7505
MWLAIEKRLKVRCTMRRYAVPVCRGLKQEREKVLEELLDYWHSCEAKSQEVVRVRKSSCVAWNPMTSSLAHSLARASMNTPDGLKATVVWDLYWLLRAQHNVKAKAYWRRWYALHRRRAELRQEVLEGSYKGSSELNDVLDATHVETMSLPTVNAAIFLMAMQPPRFQAEVGRHVTVQDLVRLANGNLKMDFSEFGDVPWAELRRIPPTVFPFLSSQLCDDPNWLRQRCLQAIPVIPSSGDAPSISARRMSEWSLPRAESHDTEGMAGHRMPSLLQPRKRRGANRLPKQSSFPESPVHLSRSLGQASPLGTVCSLPELKRGASHLSRGSRSRSPSPFPKSARNPTSPKSFPSLVPLDTPAS